MHLMAEVEGLNDDPAAQLWQLLLIVRRRPFDARPFAAQAHGFEAGLRGFFGQSVHDVNLARFG